MTREEALEYLKNFKDDQTWDGMPEEALDMAIKALEQKPKCDDCEIVQACIMAGINATQKALNYSMNKIKDMIRRKAKSGQWSDATVYGMLKAITIIDEYEADRKALAEHYRPKLKADMCFMDEFVFMTQAESEET